MIPKTIVFIHGAWVGPECWDRFSQYFTKLGYHCLAPAWERRAGVGVLELVAQYAKIIRALPEPPILIGHSYGGLLVQMLLDQGLGAKGIAIDSAPPKGLLAWRYPSIVRAFYRILLTPGGWNKLVRIRWQEFGYGFVHRWPKEQQRQLHAQVVVPETGRIFFQSAFSMFNRATAVNFRNPHRAPLLLIAGADDKVTPLGLVHSNYKQYAQTSAHTDYHVFPNRTHWLIADAGWEEIAADIAKWLK